MRLLALGSLLLTIGCGAMPDAGSCELLTDQCQCYARKDCQMVTESCWCPSECIETIRCVCGGGKFERCKSK